MDYRDKIGEIPEDWEAVKANKHLVLESGMRPSQHVTDNVNDIPSLGGENVHEDGYLVFDNIRYISREYFLKMPKGKIIDGDILINKDGANTGKIAFTKLKPFPECAVNEHLFIIRNTGDFNQDFLFYFLFSEKGNVQIQKKVVGSAQGGINNSFPKGIFLPKPPKPEQTAIATILSKVDEAIATTQNSIKAAEKLKKALMQNLLTGKLKPDGTWRTDDEFYVDEKFGKVPKGWEVRPLKELAGIQRGKFSHRPRNEERFYNGIHPFVQTSDVVKSVFYLKEYSQTLSDLGVGVSKKFEKGTIIITIAANIGDVALTKYDVYFPDSLIGIKSNNEIIDSDFLLISLMTKQRLLNQVATESAQKNINYGNLRPLPILYPRKIEDQVEIASQIKACFEAIETKHSKIQTLQRLKKSLMQNLLTGKVRLPAEFIKEFEKEEKEVVV